VVYIEDEHKGVEFAKLFFEKGFDNIYLLSGGFESFAANYSELLEGKKASEYQGKN
jgi:centrosomal protein CEP41